MDQKEIMEQEEFDRRILEAKYFVELSDRFIEIVEEGNAFPLMMALAKYIGGLIQSHSSRELQIKLFKVVISRITDELASANMIKDKIIKVTMED